MLDSSRSYFSASGQSPNPLPTMSTHATHTKNDEAKQASGPVLSKKILAILALLTNSIKKIDQFLRECGLSHTHFCSPTLALSQNSRTHLPPKHPPPPPPLAPKHRSTEAPTLPSSHFTLPRLPLHHDFNDVQHFQAIKNKNPYVSSQEIQEEKALSTSQASPKALLGNILSARS